MDIPGTYKSVPVSAARDIANVFDKNVVVIVSWDSTHNLMHTTTYGKSEMDKIWSASLGEIVTKAAGGDVSQKLTNEDWRLRTEAGWAIEKDNLLKRIKTLEDQLVWAATEEAERS